MNSISIKQLIDSYYDSKTIKIITISVLTTIAINKCYDLYENEKLNWKTLKSNSFRLFIRLPIIRSIAKQKLENVQKSMSKRAKSKFSNQTFTTSLPRDGLSMDDVIGMIEQSSQQLSKAKWSEGRVSGTVYANISCGQLNELVTRVYGMTAYTNPLHPEVFPHINKMEAEIVRIVCSLFNGDPNESCGTLTSGGTESIVLAVKAFRDYAREVKHITRAEIVCPITAHAAFQKATQLLGMRIRFVEVSRDTYKVDVNAMRDVITANTVLLVGSACGFPHGIIDPIEDIAKLGLSRDIPVHVDSCLGGFLVPFMSEAGYPLPHAVDFTVEGVSSISADTHKYGYAPKGSSVVMYRHKKYRHHQYSVQTDWPGGIYASPTIAGSRAGANIATCWATLMHVGHSGYVESTRAIMSVQQYLKTELKQMKELFIFGDPLMSVIAIGSKQFNIFDFSEQLSSYGWHLNPLQFPSGVHLCVTQMHCQEGVKEQLIEDIKTVINELKNRSKDGVLSVGSDGEESMGAIYGMSQTLPDRSLVSNIACDFLDGMYETYQ